MQQARLLIGQLLPLAQQVWRHERIRRQAPKGDRTRDRAAQVATGRGDAGERSNERSLERKVVIAPARSELVRHMVNRGLVLIQ